MSAEAHAPSYYAATANAYDPFPVLDAPVDVDVCVIGGGFTGLSAALHLRERGFSVAVLEANRVGWGASGRNGGQLHTGQRRDQQWLEKEIGEDGACKMWALGREAVETFKRLIAEHDIACDYRDGLLHGVHKKAWLDDEKSHVEHLQKRYGYDAIRYLDADEINAALGTDSFYGGHRDAEAGHVHPLNYAIGLAEAARRAGAQIFEGTRATGLDRSGGLTVTTERAPVKAKSVVLAGNGYLRGLDRTADAVVMPINNFVIGTEPMSDARVAATIPGREAASDSRFVVNYWRITNDNRMLFGGGENYSPNFPRDISGFVRPYMLKLYPGLADLKIDYAWGGTLAVTVKRMPFLKRLDRHVYYAGGYSGQGVGTATFAGKLLAEAIAGEMERFDVFGKVRLPKFRGGDLLRYPTLVLAMTWFALRDRL